MILNQGQGQMHENSYFAQFLLQQVFAIPQRLLK